MERMIPIMVDSVCVGVTIVHHDGTRTVLLNQLGLRHSRTIDATDFIRMFPDM